MTALIYYISSDEAVVATDTVTKTEDPAYLSKFVYLPHIRTIVAITGISRLMWDWLLAMSCHPYEVTGIEALAGDAPRELRSIYDSYGEVGTNSTIYHFGFSEVTGEMVGHRFHSAEGFALDRLPHGVMFMKPPLGDMPPPGNSPEANVETLLRAQKAQEDQKDPDERCYIGGEGVLIRLTREGAVTRNLFAFD